MHIEVLDVVLLVHLKLHLQVVFDKLQVLELSVFDLYLLIKQLHVINGTLHLHVMLGM